jgi:heme/copper-type cytochrome/quinol oxidase subunit 1
MHSLVRRYLKTAIVFLGVGLGLGVWMMGERELFIQAPTPYIVSAHTHAILVGFVMMMILGVALWLFPRPAKEDTRYTPRAASAAYWMLTVSTAARIAGELSRAEISSAWLRGAVFTAGVVQTLAVGLFFFTMWSRIRPAGSQTREEKGERF